MTECVLVLNAGSSSLKYRVVDPASGAAPVRGLVERLGSGDAQLTHTDADGEHETALDGDDHAAALAAVHDALAASGVEEGSLVAVGHRVVHGGARLTRPHLVDDEVLADIEHAARLAPLHNPPALEGIRSARATYPSLPQVACFDTAFFADLPAAAATYALDRELAGREEIRRYGAHGISHEYVAGEAARLLGRPDARLITLHLGNGASAAAVRAGRPVETSMGLTPLEGLVMGTRGGDLDPGILLHLLRHARLDADGLDDLLEHRSGLQGLAGCHDFRDLLAAVDAGSVAARTAYDVYCHRLRKYVGAYTAVLGGLDGLVFTAGVGEHVARLRADALAGLQVLGLEVDPARNTAPADGPRPISPDDSPVTVLVVPTDEELAIARATVALIGPEHVTPG
ncbi:acetate/propionate family kinase [Nocardioides panaciterrulae]|uniref:Acetate kinase n=1 Tax=Nocardioides panaciterrulae TaxID=661492 RepID=A0A7Y9JAI3_9ACTN|nr:acetate/propionate family kinase [Nocardioides panaciterrulae]NYD40359.1 acetate kinase [Nocardioides panaciterrulae]